MDFESQVEDIEVVTNDKKTEVDADAPATHEALEPPPLSQAAESSVEEEAPGLEPEPVAPPAPPPVAVTPSGAGDAGTQPYAESEQSLKWLWGGVIGGGIGAVVGVILTLLILAGINGSLNYGRSQIISALQNRAQSLDADLNTLNADVDTLTSELAGVREQQDNLNEAFELLQDQQAQLERGVNVLRESLGAEEDLNARIETTEAEIASLQQRTEALVEDNVTLRDDLNAETTRLENALAEETAQLQASLAADLAAEATRLQEEIDVVSETVSLMETSAGALTEVFEETDERLERIEAFFDRLNNLLRDFFGMPMSEIIEEQP